MDANAVVVLLYVGIPILVGLYLFITDENTIGWFIDMCEKTKKFLINAGIVLAFICFVSIMAYVLIWGNSSNDYEYDEEEIEDIINDPKWNIPSRYRD